MKNVIQFRIIMILYEQIKNIIRHYAPLFNYGTI